MHCAFLELSDHLNPVFMGFSESEQELNSCLPEYDMVAANRGVMAMSTSSSSSDGGTSSSKQDNSKGSLRHTRLATERRFSIRNANVDADKRRSKGRKMQRAKVSTGPPKTVHYSYKMKAHFISSKC